MNRRRSSASAAAQIRLTVGKTFAIIIKLEYGEMSEWFMELVLKTSDAARHRGFESLSLRQFFNSILSWRSTQVAVRGSPAKGVGSAKGREGSNPSFSARCPP